MGLKNRNENLNYLRIKGGKFYIAKDETTPYQELEGQVVELKYKDEEYEGKPQRKLIVILQDGEDKYHLGINVETSSYSNLVSFLANVDLRKTIALHPKEDVINKNGVNITKKTILVSQEGKFAKSYFTKEDNKGLPEWKSVNISKKIVLDKSEYLDFLEDFVLTKLAKQIIPSQHTIEARVAVNTPETKNENTTVTHKKVKETATDTVEDDTPFPWQ